MHYNASDMLMLYVSPFVPKHFVSQIECQILENQALKLPVFRITLCQINLNA